MKNKDVVDTLDIVLDRVDGQAVSLSDADDGAPERGEEKPNSRTYKVVRRVYTRGPYRGRQTIREQVLKVNNHEGTIS